MKSVLDKLSHRGHESVVMVAQVSRQWERPLSFPGKTHSASYPLVDLGFVDTQWKTQGMNKFPLTVTSAETSYDIIFSLCRNLLAKSN
jgi:glucuronosyltransferase